MYMHLYMYINMKIDMSLDMDVDQGIDSGMGMDMNKDAKIYRFKNLNFDKINRLMASELKISICDPNIASKLLSPEENLSIFCIKFKETI